MIIVENKTFERFYDANAGWTASDIELRRCRFVSCRLSQSENPAARTLVRNVRVIDCAVDCSAIDTAILEDVLVDGFRTYAQPPFFAWGAVFKHVTLKGNIDYIVLNVREARFKECDIRSVPARLIMRDPDTQAVVNRESALKVEWKRDATNGWKAVRVGNRVLDLSKTWWPSMIQFMLDDGRHDIVLIAPTRNPKFRELLDGIKMLRDVGVAEPN